MYNIISYYHNSIASGRENNHQFQQRAQGNKKLKAVPDIAEVYLQRRTQHVRREISGGRYTHVHI